MVMTEQELEQINHELAGKGPGKVIEWASNRFGEKLTLASSFGGLSGAVVLDIAVRIDPGISVFYLDTEFLFEETYSYRDVVSEKYGISPIAFKSRWSPDQQAKEFGSELWKRDPDMCCQLRKVEPNGRALESYDAWITGLRRDQSARRSSINLVDWDNKFDLLKINPVAEWSEEQLWQYIRDNQVVYNRLLDTNYKSIGCVQCTRPVEDGEDARSGRWDGFSKDECGIN